MTPEDREIFVRRHSSLKNLCKETSHRFVYRCTLDGVCNCGHNKAISGLYCEHVIALNIKCNLLNDDFFLAASDPIWRSSTYLECFPDENFILKTPDINCLTFDDSLVQDISDKRNKGRPTKNERFKRFAKRASVGSKKEFNKRRKFLNSNYDNLMPSFALSDTEIERTPTNDVNVRNQAFALTV